MKIQKTDINAIDLNLLKFLSTLLRERNVTRAGARMGLSQPAASRALSRLRELFQDKVVVRTSSGVEPTPRILALEPLVERLLEDIRGIVAPAQFDPATAQQRFTIACLDHIASIVLPKLVARTEQAAPGVTLDIPPPSGNNVDSVARGDADIALGVFDSQRLPAGFHQRKLYDEDLVCVTRRGHPLLSSRLPLEAFAASSHIVVTITGQGNAQIDTALAALGKSRRVSMRLPHFLVAPTIVASSDLILSLPRRLAMHITQSLPLEVTELPLRAETFSMSMIWHERAHGDPAQIWLRQQIIELSK
ncbi:LysR family transcriptional regulator [Serratia ureilytica]|uniref:LysR family transcriptional regulator n=1 Tax=Serratia ureilytica TaxID=300181 RepID=UPI0018D607FC|nr:LysR family transcriptional regulator [Serratia ureilytica]MBH2895029.1 LysR family transcriptional regulator [Serratia ureilytica]MBH3018230.1 LysR family transcriptional regulator [Serratia ureilytica]